MKNGKPNDSAIAHVGEYIGHRIAGANKQESAQMAGYSVTTSRNPSLIEATKAYAIVVSEMLDKNTRIMRLMIDSVENDIKTGVFDELGTKTKAEIAHKLAQIHDIMTPKVTIKESKDANGNVTRTSWGTGSLQPSDKE